MTAPDGYLGDLTPDEHGRLTIPYAGLWASGRSPSGAPAVRWSPEARAVIDAAQARTFAAQFDEPRGLALWELVRDRLRLIPAGAELTWTQEQTATGWRVTAEWVPPRFVWDGTDPDERLAAIAELGVRGDAFVEFPPPRHPRGEAVSACGRHVSWWDGEYEGECELPAEHDGDHWDGLSWFDDDGERTDHRHGE